MRKRRRMNSSSGAFFISFSFVKSVFCRFVNISLPASTPAKYFTSSSDSLYPRILSSSLLWVKPTSL